MPWARRTPKKPQLTRDQALQARPVRNPALKWRENDDGEVEVILPRRTDLTGKFLAWMFFVPEAKPITLDAVGSFVWLHCDGEHTVDKLVAMMSEEYRVGKREIEFSFTEYLQTLGKRGMVGFLIPKSIAAELGDAAKDLVGLEEIGESEQDLRKADAGAQEVAQQEQDPEQSESAGTDEQQK